ncbi:MAG: twin-arginine translocase TatA/TatE family subunit, partial [Thermoanaerobaculia bacterium]|nr:twin-arginine translocase TatA/TatE family subunit [Thermoanaerobaculia bacterium]
MFGPIGMPELIVIFLVALLIFGPRKLPEIGKTIGKGLSEFKRASDDLKRTIEDEIEEGKREASAVRREINAVSDGLKAAVTQ